MGWTWRRSTSVGPLRFNFSSAGVGVSVGVRGARLSTGPRGTYIHVGAGGFRYSQRIDGTATGHRSGALRQPPSSSPVQTITPGRTVEVLDPSLLLDSTPDQLLEEIRRKEQTTSLVPIAVGLSALGFTMFLVMLIGTASPWMTWGMLAIGLLGLISVPWAMWNDRRVRLVRLHYVFDPLGESVHKGLERLLAAFERAHAIWAVHHEQVHGDWKRHGGAGTSVGRRRVQVGWGAPSNIKTNARIGFLNIDGVRLFFFPDRLLIFGRGGVRGVRYADLKLEAGFVQFREEDAVPRDAKVAGTTWRYVNKDGGPDRRFNNNYQIPIVHYGTLDISAPSGMRLSLQTSTDALAASSVELLRVIQAAVRELESRRTAAPRLEPLPAFVDDPPPFFLPGLMAFRGLGTVFSFRWMEHLPDWAKPAIWGVLFALPPVALIIRFARPGTAANAFLCAAFTTAGAGIGVLLYTHLRRNRENRTNEDAATKSRFRALLANELKTRSLEDVKFSALVAASDISRRGADVVADAMFRNIADRFAHDGIITSEEHGKLNTLAKALDMNCERAERIEAEAKAARYHQAVSEALADGTVTDEEAYLLNRLQSQLGITDLAWSAGGRAHRD